jgi:hypothetical protein
MAKMTALDYAKAFGFLTVEEVLALKKYTRGLRENANIINIGAGTGTSALAMAEERPDLIKNLVTVDITAEVNPLGGLGNERTAFDNGEIKPYPVQVCCDSKKLAEFWGAPVDLLIIDGDHSYAGAVGDMNGWLRFVWREGIVVVHDMDGQTWPEVVNAVRDVMGDWEEIERAGRYAFYKHTR